MTKLYFDIYIDDQVYYNNLAIKGIVSYRPSSYEKYFLELDWVARIMLK